MVAIDHHCVTCTFWDSWLPGQNPVGRASRHVSNTARRHHMRSRTKASKIGRRLDAMSPSGTTMIWVWSRPF
jgi:hypothetical protein